MYEDLPQFEPLEGETFFGMVTRISVILNEEINQQRFLLNSQRGAICLHEKDIEFTLDRISNLKRQQLVLDNQVQQYKQA